MFFPNKIGKCQKFEYLQKQNLLHSETPLRGRQIDINFSA